MIAAKKYQIGIYFLLSMLIASIGAAQPSSKQWLYFGLDEGLTNLQINTIGQDDSGYLWLGTNEGLKRFDGEFFVTLSSGKFPFIERSVVTEVVIDSAIIWFAVNNRGLFRYDLRTKEIDQIPLQIDGEAIKNINQIYIDASSIILSLDRSGMITLDKENPLAGKMAAHEVWTVMSAFPLSRDTIFANLLGRGYAPIVMDSVYDVRSEFEIITRPLDPIGKPTYTCDEVIIKNQFAWLGCWDNALHHFNIQEKKIESFLLPNEAALNFNSNEIYALAKFNSALLIGTKYGELFLFDTLQRKFEPFDVQYFKGKRINTIFVDDKNLVWIGTKNGLFALKYESTAFAYFDLKNEQKRRLRVNVLAASGDTIYIGTNSGLYSWDSGIIKQVMPSMVKGRPFNFEAYSIHSLLIDGMDLYSGTQKTVFKYDRRNNQIEDLFDAELVRPEFNYFQPNEIEFSRYNTMVIQDTPQGRLLWAMAYGHFIAFYNLDEHWVGYAKYYSNFQENLINRFFVDDENRLHVLGKLLGYYENLQPHFVGCQEERFFQDFDFKTQCKYEFISLKADTLWDIENLKGIHSNDFRKVVFYNNDRFLSTSSGLYKMSENQEITPLNLPYNDIQNCVLYQDQLWLISNGRLIHYDIESEKSQVYAPTDNFQSEVFTPNILVSNGQLILGGEGFLAIGSFDKLLEKQTELFPLLVSEVRTLHSAEKLPATNNNYFSHEKEGGVIITFAALHFPQARNINYQYRISSLNEDWIDNGTNNELILPGLGNGHHQIEISALNGNQEMIADIEEINIIIKPYWYNTWAFRILTIMAFLSIIYGIYRFRLDQQRRISEMRNDISSDLHDDIGSLLGSISIYSESALNAMDNDNRKGAISILDKIGIHSRTMIDKMSDIVWSIHSEKDTLEDLMERMRIYGQGLCLARGINFSFQNAIDTKDKLSMKERKNLYLIYKEFINNTLKHASAKEIKVNIYPLGKKMVFHFMDNGIGFEYSDQLDAGFGLGTMRKRAAELNGALEIESSTGKGTAIKLIF